MHVIYKLLIICKLLIMLFFFFFFFNTAHSQRTTSSTPTPVVPHASTEHQVQTAAITSAALPTAQQETKYYTIYTLTIGPGLALAGIILVTVVSICAVHQQSRLQKSLKYRRRNEASSPSTGMRVSTGKHLLELDKHVVHFTHQIKILVTLGSQNCIGCNAPWFVGRLQLSCTPKTYSLDAYEPPRQYDNAAAVCSMVKVTIKSDGFWGTLKIQCKLRPPHRNVAKKRQERRW